MQFRKISDSKIHCVISEQEMFEKGIEIDDFLEHREKTEEFLRDILAEAKYELDIDDMGHFFSVQMSVMPEGGVSLVISGEKSEEVGDALAAFGQKLEGFKEMLKEAKKQVKKQPEEVQSYVEEPLWIVVSTMDRCIAVAQSMVSIGQTQGALYKYKDAFYFKVQFSKDQHKVAGAILLVSEFSDDIFTQSQGGGVIEEHGEVLIAEDAFLTLANL